MMKLISEVLARHSSFKISGDGRTYICACARCGEVLTRRPSVVPPNFFIETPSSALIRHQAERIEIALRERLGVPEAFLGEDGVMKVRSVIPLSEWSS